MAHKSVGVVEHINRVEKDHKGVKFQRELTPVVLILQQKETTQILFL